MLNKDEIIRMAREAVAERHEEEFGVWWSWEEIERFAQLVAAAEREVITDEYWSCVQSDLEHGVKSLNEEASRLFKISMPEVSKFGGWLEARGQQ